jgi:hypothetical protein
MSDASLGEMGELGKIVFFKKASIFKKIIRENQRNIYPLIQI